MISFGQETNQEYRAKIGTVLENYFDLEREAIHLHTNKSVYLTNETIWYQGYIFNRKTNKPFFTTNVFVLLYDEKGDKISEKLIYASNGIFSGEIKLNSKIHSGEYYIQTYTNWMNNFSENESTLTKINIINPDEGIKNYNKINPETLEIFINPEGGNYITEISNSIGVSIKDCHNNAPENIEISLENSNGEVLKSLKLNKFGFGKFELIPEENSKITFFFNQKKYEKPLPIAEKIGIGMEINNVTMEGKVIITLRTNNQTKNLIENKKLFLLAHQDQKYNLFDISFKSDLEQTLTLKTTDFFEGITTLRIIDSGMKEYATRQLFILPKIEAITDIQKNIKKDGTINLIANTTFKNANLSISILPEDNISWDRNNNIISGLLINPYLSKPIENASYYLQSINRNKLYELDLILLDQKNTKYNWESMRISKPTSNFSFDVGLNIKGTINAQIKNKTYHKVKLISKKDLLMMSSDVTEKGDYNFEHVLVADSTYVNMSLQKLPDFDEIDNVFTPQISNRKRPFYKPLNINFSESCTDVTVEKFNSDFDFPKLASNVIQLKEVKIVNEKKKMTYENKFGNANLRGYKIDETLVRQNLLNFIEQNGFDVVRSMGEATVYSRGITTLKGAKATPLITIDERQLFTHAELSIMSMEEIDEIYLNPYGIVPSINNFMGIIKIYTKKTPFTKINTIQNKNSFYIKEGYSRINPFKNVNYINTQSLGFDNYGVIGWSPRKFTNENGQFNFEIIDYNKSKAKTIIEGMTNEGILIQEEKTIDLK